MRTEQKPNLNSDVSLDIIQVKDFFGSTKEAHLVFSKEISKKYFLPQSDQLYLRRTKGVGISYNRNSQTLFIYPHGHSACVKLSDGHIASLYISPIIKHFNLSQAQTHVSSTIVDEDGIITIKWALRVES